LEARFDSFKALESYRGGLALVVPVMLSVGRIIAQHATVVSRVDSVIDIGEVISDNPALPVDPNLAAQDPAALCAGQIKALVHHLPEDASHDL
jgi:hypothetical protein